MTVFEQLLIIFYHYFAFYMIENDLNFKDE